MDTKSLAIATAVFPLAAPMTLPMMASTAQGEAAQAETKVAAQNEKDAAKWRTDQRLQQVRALRSAQRVAAAGAGLDPSSGSVGAIDADLASQARAMQSQDDVATRQRISTLRYQGINARRSGWINAGSSLIETGMQAGSLALMLG